MDVDYRLAFALAPVGLCLSRNRVIIDWRSNQRGTSLKPALVVKDKDGKVQKLARGGEVRGEREAIVAVRLALAHAFYVTQRSVTVPSQSVTVR